jgi:hypothetical protein
VPRIGDDETRKSESTEVPAIASTGAITTDTGRSVGGSTTCGTEDDEASRLGSVTEKSRMSRDMKECGEEEKSQYVK